MISLNEYLYAGDTVLRILHKFSSALRMSSAYSGNEMDRIHSEFLDNVSDLLEHNDFLTAQSQQLRDFYKYMVQNYQTIAFTFKGRIKSLVRTEEKFNGYIIETVTRYYREHGEFPPVEIVQSRLTAFRDLVAYRIVISIPKRHLGVNEDRREAEKRILYEIANELPGFLEKRGFIPEKSAISGRPQSELLEPSVKPYYRDYVEYPKQFGYQSLHITLFDTNADSYFEVQLRTQEMDNNAEIGLANHASYEEQQKEERKDHTEIPHGVCEWYDDACERLRLLQTLDLSSVDVNMFGAVNNQLINDGCGFFRGRLILPYEHLSSFQNDLID